MDWPEQAETILELKADGGGTWRVRDEEVPFSWYTRGSEVRINTKEGGLIAGTIEEDTIHITLPGSMRLSFKKTR